MGPVKAAMNYPNLLRKVEISSTKSVATVTKSKAGQSIVPVVMNARQVSGLWLYYDEMRFAQASLIIMFAIFV